MEYEKVTSSIPLETTDDPEMIVRDVEAKHLRRLKMTHLPPQARQILLLAASLHIEGRGLTIGDLQAIGFKKDNAEKKIQDARRNGFLVPGEKRKGKQKQYYLSNYKHILDRGIKRDVSNTQTSIDDDIVIKLLQLLSNRNYSYHNIHIETSLNYKDDYELFRWQIPSQWNKQKVIAFKLSLYRKCTIVVSPNGTVNITIECTHQPYEFHTSEGIIEFIGSCGQALNLLQEAANNRLNVVPPISEWYPTQFDYNIDLPLSSNNNNNTSMSTQVLCWSSPSSLATTANGRLKIKHLGTIFQIYPKGLPDHGECLRLEGHYIAKEKKKKLSDSIGDMIASGGHIDEDNEPEKDDNKKSPFETAESLLKKSQK